MDIDDAIQRGDLSLAAPGVARRCCLLHPACYRTAPSSKRQVQRQRRNLERLESKVHVEDLGDIVLRVHRQRVRGSGSRLAGKPFDQSGAAEGSALRCADVTLTHCSKLGWPHAHKPCRWTDSDLANLPTLRQSPCDNLVCSLAALASGAVTSKRWAARPLALALASLRLIRGIGCTVRQGSQRQDRQRLRPAPPSKIAPRQADL